MMKRLHLIGLLFLLGIGFNTLLGQTISVQNYPLIPGQSFTLCQCDTLDGGSGPGHKKTFNYVISSSFNTSTQFYFELASPANNWAAADTLEILEITGASFPNDTFTGPDTKIASLVIPCNAPLGTASIRLRNSNGVISDTAYVNINRIPDTARIKRVLGGFPNPYTVALQDWGFCEGDSVILDAEQQPGANYQWLRNGLVMAGETDTMLIVRSSGSYSVRIDLGACSRESKDTTINAFLPPVNVEFLPSAMAFQMDDPKIDNVSREDSVMFCESVTATFNAQIPPPPDVTFEYQWITDTIDPNSGNPVYFPVDTVTMGPRTDTSQTVVIDSSLISFRNGEARLYLTVYDGFCNDTSETIYLFMDSIPATTIRNRLWEGGVLQLSTSNSDICMKEDSLHLVSSYVAPNIRYQWQRSLNGTSWTNLPSASNPSEDGSSRTLEVDTGYNPKPTPTITFYRLVTTTVTPFTSEVVCRYISDSVRIRWLPDYRIEVAPGQPQVTFISPDTVNFCEVDTAILRGPLSPNSFTLPYDYIWLKDTVNAIGQTIKIPTDVNDTLRNVTVRSSGKYYVAFDDGICIDTSRAIYVYVDTIPRTNLVSVPFAGIPAKPEPFDRCLYDSVQISATDTILPNWKYQWQRYIDASIGWIDLVGDTNPAIVVDTSYTPFRDTTYFRLVINYTNRFGIPGCEFVSDSVEIRFYDLPEVSFFPSDSVGLCFGETVRVVAEGNALSYRWADGPVGASRVFSSIGTYTLIATGINGCVTETEVDIYDITITANAGPDQTVNSGKPVTLTASGGTTYRWYASEPLDFNDFLSQTIQVSKTLSDSVVSDTIKVYVIATGDDGCQDTDSLNLIVLNPRGRDLVLLEKAYNLFTPNADGRNDVWDISEVVGLTGGCDIIILNRWGSVTFEQEGFSGVWDGNDLGGNPLPDGTYYYILTCDDQVLLKSAVTIIRNE